MMKNRDFMEVLNHKDGEYEEIIVSVPKAILGHDGEEALQKILRSDSIILISETGLWMYGTKHELTALFATAIKGTEGRVAILINEALNTLKRMEAEDE
jgi:hypothetical protein